MSHLVRIIFVYLIVRCYCSALVMRKVVFVTTALERSVYCCLVAITWSESVVFVIIATWTHWVCSPASLNHLFQSVAAELVSVIVAIFTVMWLVFAVTPCVYRPLPYLRFMVTTAYLFLRFILSHYYFS